MPDATANRTGRIVDAIRRVVIDAPTTVHVVINRSTGKQFVAAFSTRELADDCCDVLHAYEQYEVEIDRLPAW